MALQWPEDDGVAASISPARPQPRRADPLSATREIWEDPGSAARGGKRHRFAYALPIAVLVGILVLLGLILALTGPLPTIFPRFDCGVCTVHN
jgi:hypothetical protein